eukprot:scaffold5834_cov107-Isochrysis_galbana.AAC.5
MAVAAQVDAVPLLHVQTAGARQDQILHLRVGGKSGCEGRRRDGGGCGPCARHVGNMRSSQQPAGRSGIVPATT